MCDRRGYRSRVAHITPTNAAPPEQNQYRTVGTHVLRPYTSSWRDVSTLPLAELSAMSNITLEFNIRARSRQRTILWAWLTLASPASWDGNQPSDIFFDASVLCTEELKTVWPPNASPVSRCSISLKNEVYTWSNEVSETVDPPPSIVHGFYRAHISVAQ